MNAPTIDVPGFGRRPAPDRSALRQAREAAGLSQQRELSRRVARATDRYEGGVQVMLSKYETGVTRTLPVDVFEVVRDQLA